MGQLLQSPALDLAPGRVEGVLRSRRVGIPFLLEQHMLWSRRRRSSGTSRGVPRLKGQWRENSSNAGPNEAR